MDEFKIKVSSLLKPLSFQKKVVFCLLICEKLVVNYQFFSKKYSWGDPNVLQKSISYVHNFILQNKQIPESDINVLIKELDIVTPYTEDFDTILVSFALDACSSISETLGFLINKNDESIVEVATFARDTVDMYIQEKEGLSLNDNLLELKIEQDSYMQNEYKWQFSVIKAIAELSEINVKQWHVLKEMNPPPIIDLTYIK
jgi:uncharacterized protein YjaG (DUF416 family)